MTVELLAGMVPAPPRMPKDEQIPLLKYLFFLPLFGGLIAVFVIFPILTKTVYPHWDALASVFSGIDPHFFAFAGTGVAIASSVIGAAWGIFNTATVLMGACVRVPKIRSKNIISVVFCEALAIYGIIMAIICLTKYNVSKTEAHTMIQSAYKIFFAGLSVGLGNLACGASLGVIGGSCAIADATNGILFVKILVIEIFASALGIFAIIVGIVMVSRASF
eukprot:GEZU01032408.1.p1 GENE.GEZU01032408.1~~GEZU01032408.1.p1  ORF type:complete len:220 (+),score=69.23 GEZU01032408.1:106-765(+)